MMLESSGSNFIEIGVNLKELWHLQCSGSNLGAESRDLDPDAHSDLGFGSNYKDSTQHQPNSSFHKYFSKNPLQKEAPK